MVRDLGREDAGKVSESIAKGFADPKLSSYAKLIDGFLKSATQKS